MEGQRRGGILSLGERRPDDGQLRELAKLWLFDSQDVPTYLARAYRLVDTLGAHVRGDEQPKEQPS